MPRQSEKRLLEFTFAEFSIKIPLILKYCNVISKLLYFHYKIILLLDFRGKVIIQRAQWSVFTL